MNGRLGVLCRLFGRGVFAQLLPSIAVLAVLAVPMFAVRWHGSGLELWGVVFDKNVIELDSGDGSAREKAMGDYLRELFSWWWVFVSLAYLLPVVLMVSAASFSRDQVLWLRMTPCSARELAVARLCRVLVALAVLSVLGLSLALAATYWHDTDPAVALWTVAGMLAHGLFAAGVVLLVGPLLRTPVDRALGSFFAFLAPIVAFMVFVALEPKLPSAVKEWWPYTIPFAKLQTGTTPHVLGTAGIGAHVLSSAAVGAVGLLLSVLVQPGHWRSENASTIGS